MKFTKKAFTAWLAGKSDRQLVGQPEHAYKCPLCNFLKSQGAESVSMGFNSRTVDGVWHSIPEWATTFQTSVCKYVGFDRHKRITANTAKKYL